MTMNDDNDSDADDVMLVTLITVLYVIWQKINIRPSLNDSDGGDVLCREDVDNRCVDTSVSSHQAFCVVSELHALCR